MNRRQSRPFQNHPMAKEVALIPPPSPALMEHLEEVFSDNDMVTLHHEVVTSGAQGASMAETALSVVAEQAGKEKVLAYLREILHRHSTGEA